MTPCFSSKNSFRQYVWSFMEQNDIARFPKPVFNRIPNFKGSFEAGCKVKELPEFKSADTIKVDPDKPMESVRYSILRANKNLLVPMPRLRHGLLYKINPPMNAPLSVYELCATSQGPKKFGKEIDPFSSVKIDLVVVGCVAVSLKGQRIGKGEGFSDIEYALMATLEMVNPDTPIVTIVHDCQVFDSMPDELFQEHDVPVDIIITPTRVIYLEKKIPKTDHIIWSILTEDKINEIPILRTFKDIEEGKVQVKKLK